MATKSKTKREKSPKAKKQMAAEAICPGCGKPVADHKCRFCGATKTINQVSGNVIWMRNGKIVRAFKDEKKAYTDMARKYGIPESEWPERFRG